MRLLGKRLIAQYAIPEGILYDWVLRRQQEVDARVARQRAHGHNALAVEWTDGWIDGQRCVLRFFERGDPTKLEVFYGGVGGPIGDMHGHIIFRRGRLEKWLLPGANGNDRIRIY